MGVKELQEIEQTPAYLKAFIESEIKKWAEPIKDANLTVN